MEDASLRCLQALRWLVPLAHPPFSAAQSMWRCSFRAGGTLHHASESIRKTPSRCISTTATRRQQTQQQQHDERLRILFCGSEQFSAFSLRALHQYAQTSESNIESIDVVTRKDKFVGRGLKSVSSPPIKSLADELKLPIHQIDTFTGWTPPSYIQDGNSPSPINLVIAVSFGLLVPPRILRGAAYGGLNVHPSLLPQFKGAAPLQWSILHGLDTTGVSLQTLHDSKFDEGIVLDRIPVSIEHPDSCTYVELRDQLGPVGAEILIKGLRENLYRSQNPIPTVTESEHLSYAPKIKKQHSAINPQMHDLQQILRMTRALSYVWAYTRNLNGNVLRILTNSVTKDPIPSARIPQYMTPTATSLPVGVPYGITMHGELPISAENSPIFMNTMDGGTLTIHSLIVSGHKQGGALKCAAKAKFLKHHASLKSLSGEQGDVYTFCAPLQGDPDGLPAIMHDAGNTATV